MVPGSISKGFALDDNRILTWQCDGQQRDFYACPRHGAWQIFAHKCGMEMPKDCRAIKLRGESLPNVSVWQYDIN